MHDTELEQHLRMALRDEADRLPLRVDVEQLEALVVTRRRATRSSRAGLLAAAIGVVAFGIAAVGLNGGLPAGILPGVGVPTPVPCTPLETSDLQAPPQVQLVDAGGVAHRGGLESYRLPGAGTVVQRGLPGGERRLDPRTTSLEVTTAEGACLLAVELEIVPGRGGTSMTERSESLEGPVASMTVSAPAPGKWLATVRATFQTTSGDTATSATVFRLVSTALVTAHPNPSTPSTSPLPAGIAAFEPAAGAEILEQVAPSWSGRGTRHVVQVPESITLSATVWAACVDESTTVDPEGMVTDLAHITVTVDTEVHEVPCIGGQPFGLTPPLTDQPMAVEVVVPADVAYTVLVERLPVPASLPTIDMDGAPEVDESSDRAVPDWSMAPGRIRRTIGTIDEGFSQEAVFTCLGPGTMTVEFRTAGSRPEDPPASSSRAACIGDPDGLTIAIGATGPHEVLVEADVRTAWHVIARSDGEIPAFTPPSLRMTSWAGEAEVDGAGAAGFVACGYSWDVGGSGSTGDQCGSPQWPDMTDGQVVIARSGGELRLDLADGWSIDEHAVRAAPYLQTGRQEPPVNVWDLESALVGDTLTIPLALSNSRWVVWVEVHGARIEDTFQASYFFVVDVQP